MSTLHRIFLTRKQVTVYSLKHSIYINLELVIKRGKGRRNSRNPEMYFVKKKINMYLHYHLGNFTHEKTNLNLWPKLFDPLQ